jgi:hypothetical protein
MLIEFSLNLFALALVFLFAAARGEGRRWLFADSDQTHAALPALPTAELAPG